MPAERPLDVSFRVVKYHGAGFFMRAASWLSFHPQPAVFTSTYVLTPLCLKFLFLDAPQHMAYEGAGFSLDPKPHHLSEECLDLTKLRVRRLSLLLLRK